MAGQTEQSVERVETIVREVLARLRAGGGRNEPGPEHSAIGHDAPKHLPEPDRPAELTLADRVVTLAALDGRVKGVHKVIVPRGTVVTPAALDWLRERGIVLSRNGEQATDRDPGHPLVVGVSACRAEPVGGRRLEEAIRTRIEMLARVGLAEVVREMAEHVVLGGRKGLLFTSQPAAALCLANRLRGVRAIGGTNAEEVGQAAAALAANLLVIQPDGKTAWSQLTMAREFVSCKVTQCPAEFAAALG